MRGVYGHQSCPVRSKTKACTGELRCPAPPCGALRAGQLLALVSCSPSPVQPCLAPQETWTLTGLARLPSAWGAARGGTRSSRGASVGTAAAAGWATSPSAEVKPGGRTGDPGHAAGLCATLPCASASTWGHSLGHHSLV